MQHKAGVRGVSYDFHFCITIPQHPFTEQPSCPNIKEEADLVQKAYDVCNQGPGDDAPRQESVGILRLMNVFMS